MWEVINTRRGRKVVDYHWCGKGLASSLDYLAGRDPIGVKSVSGFCVDFGVKD